jgi:kinesin family protein 18/19
MRKNTRNQSIKRNDNRDLQRSVDIDTEKQKEIMSVGKANILVVVRCRPLSKKESELSDIETVKIVNDKVVFLLDPSEMKGINTEENPLHRSKEQQYAFDYAFNKNSQQADVYESSAKFLIPGILEGYNATVFAYGATGAGKTHTMLGSDMDPGIMVRTLADLFASINNISDSKFKVRLNYVEIYNETLRDLLNNGATLELREDPNKGCTLAGVNDVEVADSREVFKLLMKGNKLRTTESTNVNETSSRSHAVLQITIENRKNNTTEASSARLILVDLAGSERASATKNTGIRLLEGANINKSLLALGNCINALVDISNGIGKNFIPWRDSKLTRILKDSLLGNSRIVMIANISPSIFSMEDTTNTLKYANRSKNIKSNIKRNVLDVDYHLGNYDNIITSLKSEVDDLRHQLAIKTHDQHLQRK